MHTLSARRIIPIIIFLGLVAASIYYLSTLKNEESDILGGSGTVEMVEIAIAPELSGRVVEVYAGEGDKVQAGETLFILDGALLQAQLERAQTGLATAQANLETAKKAQQTAQANVNIVQVQYEIALANAQRADQANRATLWQQAQPTEIDRPIWYFSDQESLSAAQTEVNTAKDKYNSTLQDLDSFFQENGGQELIDAETNLAEKEAAFRIANEQLNRARQNNDAEFRDRAQEKFDIAREELRVALDDLQDLLDQDQQDELNQIRADLALAKDRYDSALDRYNSLLTGEDSLSVRQAAAALELAQAQAAQTEAAVNLAEKSIGQAQAEINLIQVQISKLTVTAPTDGIILTRSVEPGEVITAGALSVTLGQPETITITVYLPESRYGQIKVGDTAEVSVDSFPGQIFPAQVIRIADQAEFTPRNVQTKQSRQTTVFAVKCSVTDLEGKLKAGMPADVTFSKP